MNRNFLRKIQSAGALAALLGCSEPELCFEGFEQHPVDQVFRDFRGYRVYFTDSRGVYLEKDYPEPWIGVGVSYYPPDVPPEIKEKFVYLTHENVDSVATIIKDLEPFQRGYANVLHYTAEKWDIHPAPQASLEIHLPKNEQLSPGYSCTGGKNPTYPPMGEIK